MESNRDPGRCHLLSVTGRSKRLVRDGSGQQRLESRSPRTNLAETTAFMTGAKRILVFSDAGVNTGIKMGQSPV